MHKLLKISAITLAAFATATVFAEDDKEFLRLKEKPSKEEVRKFCRHWDPEVKEKRKLEVVFEGKEREEARKGYERHCRKHEEGKEGEGYGDKDRGDKDHGDKGDHEKKKE